ncbi:MAG: HD domain-containing protein [Fibromonadaceae bacterium]|jgi:putative nucleotidyltransferase with HDIG domain|nr:HD domain-containing protein [Fibromonadaceae bacterium]
MINKPFFHFVICTIVFTTFTMILFPVRDIAQKSELPMIGQSSTRSIIAPISFEVLKNPQELEEEKKKARDKVYPVFEYNEETTKKLSEDFNLLMSQIETYSHLQKEISANTADQKKINSAGDLYQSLVRKISSTALNQLIQNEALRDTLKTIFHSMLSQGISNTLIAERSKDVAMFEESYNVNSVNYILYSRGEVLLIRNNRDSIVGSSSIRPKEFLIDAILDKYQNAFKSNLGISSAFYEVLYVFASPNIFYLDKETENRRMEAALQVNTSKGMIPRGMEIVSQGSIITKEILEKLEAMQNALQKDASQVQYTAPYGQRILLLLIVSMLCMNMWSFRHNKSIGPLQIWAITVIVIIQVIMFRVAHDFLLTFIQNEYLNPVWFYPFAFAPVLASVLFPLRIAGALAMWSSVLFGMFAGYDLALCIASYIISFAMCLIVNRIRYRVRFMQALGTGLVLFAVALASILFLQSNMSWATYWQNFLLGAANFLICVTFISVFCNVFERIFQITTNLRLAELSDFNHPLMRNLLEYAPGSFYHSIQVGNLGEIAGERIGANTLLIRVMALYHDIGKIMRPEFFTENQRFGYNPHDNLSPSDSMKILRSHVQMGIEFAEEYNLPSPVAAGIREHHGTSVASYFYNKAKEMYPDKEIKFSDFCYKGIIPQSKEAAVLMLADSIEAISRSMQNAKPDDLSNMIQKTIEDKMFDDQLNESGLTIQDLEELGEGFLQALEGSTHSRVQYPGSVFSKKSGEVKR